MNYDRSLLQEAEKKETDKKESDVTDSDKEYIKYIKLHMLYAIIKYI